MRIIIVILLIGLILLSGCIASPKENVQCSNFCRSKGMDYTYVDSFVRGGPYCKCQIHMLNLLNSPTTFQVRSCEE